jgi:nucleotide-binding universal stress UspA family protein
MTVRTQTVALSRAPFRGTMRASFRDERRARCRRIAALRASREAAMCTFKNIVVPVDFSETSAEAWRLACEMSAMSGSRLHLLHVVPEARDQIWAADAMAVELGAIGRERVMEADRKLAQMVPTPAIDPVRLTRTVVTGVIHTGIVRFAAAQKADLIVMGTHGYGPLVHLLLGSVAERVVRQASCPILTVPHRLLRGGEARQADAATATSLTR